MGFWDFIKRQYPGFISQEDTPQEPTREQPENSEEVSNAEFKKEGKGNSFPSGGRSSVPDTPYSLTYLNTYYKGLNVLQPAWYLEHIPTIRRLSESNEDMGQALHNIVTLGNTGHKVYFDDGVDPKEVQRMRDHLSEKLVEWSDNLAGDGLVNRMISQAIIGGAISNEWVVNVDLDGLEGPVFIVPENIRFILNRRKTKYIPYQKLNHTIPGSKIPGLIEGNLIPLNLNTYRYFALGGDGECPYGVPAYLTALDGLKTQKNMKDNINFVIKQLGIMGFTTLYIDKPEMLDGENVQTYEARLERRLEQAKNRANQGFKDGVIVAYKDDHEVEFNSISREFDGVTKLFEQNEVQTASGLKQDASLMGRGYATSESQISIVFTKLLSELANIQNLVRANLEFGYNLELQLAGFKHKIKAVKFNRSTLQDELKFQQGREILIRNLHTLRVDGIINQDQYADESGYGAPASPEPVVPFEQQEGKPTPDAAQQERRQGQKTDSARRERAKKKPQGAKKQ